MVGRGSAPGERRGGRQKGTPNKVTVKRAAEIAASGKTPLDFMLSVLRDEDASIKERMWAAVAAAPYCHAKPRPVAANAAGVVVEVVHITHEERLAELDALGVETDNRRGVREPALPPQIPPPQTPPQPPVPALVAAPVPCETRPIHRANGNGNSTTQPQRVNGHPRRVNGAVVRRSDDEIRNISDRRRALSDYPATHPVHGIA